MMQSDLPKLQIPESSSDTCQTLTAEYRMLRFFTAIMLLTGLVVSGIGLIIVHELRLMAIAREEGFSRLNHDLAEIKESRAETLEEWSVWREEISVQLRDLQSAKDKP